MRDAHAEGLARRQHVPKELATALRQILIITRDVPLTDGCRRNLGHEGHNYNVMFVTLTIFATVNFAHNCLLRLLQLLDGEDHLLDALPLHLTDDAPNLPTSEKRHCTVSSCTGQCWMTLPTCTPSAWMNRILGAIMCSSLSTTDTEKIS